MPLRQLLRYFMHNEQIIQKLAESYPMRRAAQLTAYIYHRGKAIGEEKLENMDLSKEKMVKFQETFSKELKEGFKNLSEEMKREQKKR